MKTWIGRYLLFTTEDYRSVGGLRDEFGAYDNLDEAVAEAERILTVEHGADAAQILDFDTRTCVYSKNRGGEKPYDWLADGLHDGEVCPAICEVPTTTPGRVNRFQCGLPIEHPGNHRGHHCHWEFDDAGNEVTP